MKIAVIGTGAMGSIYAARFSKAGHEVVAVDVWQDHVDQINKNGLLIDGPDGQIIAKNIRASTKILDFEGCDFYIIATKALHLEETVKNLKEQIDLKSPIITIQNGLGAGDIILEHLPKNNIILGVAEGFGASVKAPGRVTHTANKQIRLGSISKKVRESELQDIVEVWRNGGLKTEVYENIEQLIWEKLLCNVTLSGPCSIFNCNVEELYNNKEKWTFALNCMEEAYSVGLARGIPFSFDDPIAYVTDFAKRVGSAKPSMLQDYETKRKTEIDFINGAIPPLAAELKVPTPFNLKVCKIIRDAEKNF
ncbi:2-dehydropantoate 2-reductase [Rhodobacteraceae bacterium]|nr:2-dehydropantoate 2-reductase [Paracoccaceae bacterium]